MTTFTKSDARVLSQFATMLLNNTGAETFLVGGCVRDGILGLPIKDVDLEVHGVPFNELTAQLFEFFGRDNVSVHGQFVVAQTKLESGFDFEFAVPRDEVKTGDGHKGFEITARPDMTVKEAVLRRDFTINALMVPAIDIDDIIGTPECATRLALRVHPDCKDFLAHLSTKGVTLHPTSEAFKEDPLRVLRAMRFLAKVPNSTPSPELIAMSREMVDTFSELSKERIHGEFKNMFLTGSRFVEAFDFLKASGWLVNMPRLNAMAMCAQDPVWHPEGDVLRHTCHCLEFMAARGRGMHTEEEFLQVMWALLIHDAWKPETFVIGEKDGRIHNPEHDKVGGEFGADFLRKQFDVPVKTAKAAAKLTELHMNHHGMDLKTNFRRAAKKLALKMDGIVTQQQLFDVVASDTGGRPPLRIENGEESMTVMFNLVQALDELAFHSQDGTPKVEPLVTGGMIMALGIPAGPLVGQIKSAALDAQVEGELQEVNVDIWLAKHIESLT